MAITVVQHTSSKAGAGSHSTAFASNVTAGNLIVVLFATSTGAFVFSCNDGALGNTYTQVGSVEDNGLAVSGIFYAKNINGGACTVAFSTAGTGTFVNTHLYEISGCDTSAPLDQSGTSSSSTPSVSTSGATTVADEIVLAIFADAQAARSGASSSTLSNLELQSNGANATTSLSGTIIVSSTGTQTATGNSFGGDTCANSIATFKILSAGSTVDLTHTLDALIIVDTDLTHTVDAIIQVTTDLTHTLDVIVLEETSLTHTLGTLIHVDPVDKTHSLDVIVNTDHDKTHTLDVVVHEDNVDKTHTLDASITATIDKTHTVDANIHEDNVDKTHPVTAIVVVDQALSHNVTVDIQQDISVTHTLDSYVVPYTIVLDEYHSVQAINVAFTTATIPTGTCNQMVDSMLYLSFGHLTGAVASISGLGLTWDIVQDNGSMQTWRAYVASAPSAGTITITPTASNSFGPSTVQIISVRNVDMSGTNGSNSVVQHVGNNSTTTPVAPFGSFTKSTNWTLCFYWGNNNSTFTVGDGSTLIESSSNFNSSMAITLEFAADTSAFTNISGGGFQKSVVGLELNAVHNLSHTVDLVLNNDKTLNHTLDVDVKQDVSKPHTVDASVSQNVDKTHTVTADIQVDESITHTVDANIATAENNKTHTVDAFINAGVDVTHTVDAFLTPQVEKQHTLDAFVQFLFNLNHTADANISEANVDLSHRNDAFVGQFTDTDKTHTIDLFVAPAVYSFQPTRAERITAGQVITITGNGFESGCIVNFINDLNASPTAVPGTSVTFVNAQTVTCVVPAPHDAFNELDRIEVVNPDGTVAILGAPVFTSGQQYRANRVADGTFSAGHPESFWQITHGSISGSANNIVDITAPAIGSLRVTVQVVDICTFFPLNVNTKDTFFPVIPGEATFVLATIAKVVNATSGQWGIKFQYYDANQFVLTTEKYIQGAPVTIPSNGSSGQTIKGYLDVAPSDAVFVRIWGEITGHSANTVIDFDPMYWSVGLSYYADNSVTHTLDASLEHAHDKTHTLDVVVQPTSDLTHTLDALVQEDNTVTHTEDAFITFQFDKTHTLDADVQADVDKTHALDVAVQRDEIANLNVDAVIAGIHDDTHTVDANITQDVNFAHTEDVFIVNQVDKTHTLDADIQQDEPVTHALDVVVHQDNVDKTHSLDVSVLVPTDHDKTHTLDALIVKDTDVAHAVDAFILNLSNLTHTLDAIAQPSFDVTHTVDTFISLQNLAITVLDQGFDNSFSSFHATHSMSSTSDKLLLVAVAISNTPGQGVASVIAVDGLNGSFDQILGLNNLSVWRYQPNLATVTGQIAITLDNVSHVDWIVLQVQGADLSANDNGFTAIRQVAEATTNIVNFNSTPLVESATISFGSVQGAANLIAGSGYTTLVSQVNPDGVNAVTVGAEWKAGNATPTITQSWDNSGTGLMIAVEIRRNIVTSEVSLETSVDAFIQNLVNKSHSLDAIINQDHSGIHAVDVVVHEDNVDKTHTLDMVVQEDGSVTHTEAALIQTETSLNQAVDTLVFQDVELKHAVDVDIILVIDQFHTVTAMISVTSIDRNHLLDVMVNQDEQVTSTIDALIQPTFDRNVTTDVVIHEDNVDRLVVTDAIIQYTQDLTQAADAIVVFQATDHIHAADAIIIFPDQARIHTVDMLVNEQVNKNNVVDALIHADNLDRAHSLDAIVLSANTNIGHLVDVTIELQAENSAEFTCFFNQLGSFTVELPKVESIPVEFDEVDNINGYFTQVAEFPITNFTVTGNIEADFIPVTLLVGSSAEVVLTHTIDASLSATGNVSHGIDMVIATVENYYTGGFANISRMTRGFAWKQ